METGALPAVTGASQPDAAPATPWLVVAGIALALFGVLGLLQAVAAYAELQAAGRDPDFMRVLLRSLVFYPPWVIYSIALFAFVDRMREQLARPGAVVGLFAASTVLFFLPYLVFEGGVVLVRQSKPLAELPGLLASWTLAGWFVDFLLFCGCFASIYGLGLVRDQLARERQRRQLASQMLELRLELERQRLAAIQAQLEPHFLFNALSAISGLVRGEDKRAALSAITCLAELLRYAMTASRRDWVSLAEELGFVRDYLELQRLRHGERMQVRIDAAEDLTRDLACPPLLLQPLVENALRHDLETHQGESDIRLKVEAEAAGLRISISNPVRGGAASNSGLGLGLGSIRDRLASRYGARARFETCTREGRFEVELLLPYDPDA
jgi:signal transduction histidine kinase